ncbi:hypothetical protein DAH81_24265 [Sphingomonas koreensis]|uniref:TFIIB-type zinc ribbon-containing protein n=1 Tax=Alphaproteobacteria TaxID=28211 RepID=UPI000F7E9026|nr:zf-TFIIB domain-containing protein [Sphingomonas koreensis]RSY03074.1 hypothetical protein DAH81_24265 [Sphingomonas koreensis]
MTDSMRPQGLLCPVCKTDLIMSERQGIEIDYCSQCRGVWLDRGELDKIIERSLGESASRPMPGMNDEGRRSHDEHGSRHGGHRRRKSFFSELFD